MMKNKSIYLSTWLTFSLLLTCCKSQLDVNIPPYMTSAAIIFKTDASAATAVNGIYTNMSESNLWRLSLLTGLSSDELNLDSNITDIELNQFYKNSLTSTGVTGGGLNDMWSVIYPIVYYANSVMAGINNSSMLSLNVKNQLTGEAKFIRAYCFFLLTNLYGNIPMPLTTDYKTNTSIQNSSADAIWKQIITDLTDAKGLLAEQYLDGYASSESDERVRPTKWAAECLLARCYLYRGMYAEAESESSLVINDINHFDLVDINDVFLKNSHEAIWQLQPVNDGVNTFDGIFFILPPSGPGADYPVYLSQSLMQSFEAGDLRATNWISSVTVGGKKYQYAYKYKVGTTGQPVTEYNTLFRLSEQYLVRAEARINQPGKVNDGISDINVIRKRARALPTPAIPTPLPDLSFNLSKDDALKAVWHERQTELFTEWGHRWFDLKRTGQADIIMPAVTSAKGGTWSPNWKLYPIPLTELQKSPGLTQTPGYN
jgi:starch-binding outer membrane protein, SusD/RagB family